MAEAEPWQIEGALAKRGAASGDLLFLELTGVEALIGEEASAEAQDKLREVLHPYRRARKELVVEEPTTREEPIAMEEESTM
ncbi:uncharacterized protein A4U43_C03F23610 [Asparagus officinalis]|uniref:Uncharacterized protein n=1 Tax=Asparagus officinalis TaxID=4686 RepID=A0A5P1FDE0_ASPOF|nr:uncharacterized protein A4U43_C03F23610 [Asparagus officinalis]